MSSARFNFRAWPIEATLLLYLSFYLPSIMLTRLISMRPIASIGRPLSGLELLPASLIVNALLTYTFVWLSGWYRDANQLRMGRWQFPFPRPATALSGIATALVLFAVPLSFTFKGVSIPYIQLIMRGDILILAPLVDFLFRRRVRWWSWVALAMVLVALVITVSDRGGLKMPPLAILTVVLYTVGYFLRLVVMTRIGKTGDIATVRAYFVEETMVALPLSVVAIAAISTLGLDGHGEKLAIGVVGVWKLGIGKELLLLGATMTAISILSLIILLDPRENAFCVPLERAASLIAGVGGALLLAWGWGFPMPRSAELVGAGILIGAVVLLSLAPRFFPQGHDHDPDSI